jgi:hypothetical protein
VKTVRFVRAIAAAGLACATAGNAWATSSEQEDWQAARKASCPELIDAYKTAVTAERKVVAAMKDAKDGTVATNVLGVTTLMMLGVGFFTWDDHSSAEENLADLRNDLRIITTVASEKKCDLPTLPK